MKGLALLSFFILAAAAADKPAKKPKKEIKVQDKYLFKSAEKPNVYRYDHKGRPILPPPEKKEKKETDLADLEPKEVTSTATANAGTLPEGSREPQQQQASPAMYPAGEDDGL